MSSITHITSLSQLDKLLTSSAKLTVIDFHATWCGPCHAIAPKYEALSKEHTHVQFLKCDVDASKDVAGRYAVSAMPTFIFLKGSQKVDQVRGANPQALENAIKKHGGAGGGSASSFSGKGHTLGSSDNSSGAAGPTVGAAAAEGLAGITNIDPQVKLFLGLFGLYLVMWWFK